MRCSASGRGSLTSTPLEFCAAPCALVNGGNYFQPRLVLGSVNENGDLSSQDGRQSVAAVSAETSEKIRAYMRYVVTNGTGSAAEYNNSSAGKTSTAQSGRYENGTEILNTWFAGFYPYSNPKYAIVVMTENGSSGSGDCAPVFRSIVEKIGNL